MDLAFSPIMSKIPNSRLYQNSTHFYNWIRGNNEFKFKQIIILKFRYQLTLKHNILAQL